MPTFQNAPRNVIGDGNQRITLVLDFPPRNRAAALQFDRGDFIVAWSRRRQKTQDGCDGAGSFPTRSRTRQAAHRSFLNAAPKDICKMI